MQNFGRIDCQNSRIQIEICLQYESKFSCPRILFFKSMLPHKFIQTLIAKSKTFFLKNNFLFLIAGITSRMSVSCSKFTIIGYLRGIHTNKMVYRTFKEIVWYFSSEDLLMKVSAYVVKWLINLLEWELSMRSLSRTELLYLSNHINL